MDLNKNSWLFSPGGEVEAKPLPRLIQEMRRPERRIGGNGKTYWARRGMYVMVQYSSRGLEGLYRVDIRSGRETELSVYEGAVEAAGQEGSVVVGERQRVSAADGRFVSEPFSLIARRDDFATWNDAREALFARGSSRSSSYLPAEYSDYGYELDSYGSWVDEADYGYVWVPRVLDSVWRPYSYGRWVWYPVIGR